METGASKSKLNSPDLKLRLPLSGWLKTGRRTTPAKALSNKGSSFSSDRAVQISPSTNQHPLKSHLPLKKRRSNAEHKEAESSMHPLVVTEKNDVHKIHIKSPKQYPCNICAKTFKSYQALGGHKVHHRVKINREEPQTEGICGLLHECTFCDKIFSTGQALGGHKRHCREPAPEKVPSPLMPVRLVPTSVAPGWSKTGWKTTPGKAFSYQKPSF